MSTVLSEVKIRKYIRNVLLSEFGHSSRPRPYNSASDGMKGMARAAKRKFAKDYPSISVKIDGRNGWIIVDGIKAVNISSASGRPMDLEEMVDKMKKTYLGHTNL